MTPSLFAASWSIARDDPLLELFLPDCSSELKPVEKCDDENSNDPLPLSAKLGLRLDDLEVTFSARSLVFSVKLRAGILLRLRSESRSVADSRFFASRLRER